jgi:hypothetical protein
MKRIEKKKAELVKKKRELTYIQDEEVILTADRTSQPTEMFDEASIMSMIADEVRSFADRRGWKWQVRRAWVARERPVKESDIFDYEWKLIPHQRGEQFEGWFYVLKLRDQNTLELSHGNDWSPGYEMGGWWSNQHTCTTIHLSSVRRLSDTDSVLQSEWGPAVKGTHSRDEAQQGRLFKLDRDRDYGSGDNVYNSSIALSNWLMIMTDRYDPNWFCST